MTEKVTTAQQGIPDRMPHGEAVYISIEILKLSIKHSCLPSIFALLLSLRHLPQPQKRQPKHATTVLPKDTMKFSTTLILFALQFLTSALPLNQQTEYPANVARSKDQPENLAPRGGTGANPASWGGHHQGYQGWPPHGDESLSRRGGTGANPAGFVHNPQKDDEDLSPRGGGNGASYIHPPHGDTGSDLKHESHNVIGE